MTDPIKKENIKFYPRMKDVDLDYLSSLSKDEIDNLNILAWEDVHDFKEKIRIPFNVFHAVFLGFILAIVISIMIIMVSI